MKNRFPVLIGVLIGLGLLAYMFMFQVRYDQVAVLTTFDKAATPVYDEAGGVVERGSLRYEPGLYWKLPWPIQKVQHYETRLRLHEHRLEQVSTADGKSVAVRVFLVWRIEDPLAFFVKLENAESATKKLTPLLSEELSGTIGRYRMEHIVNASPAEVRLEDIEAEALMNLQARLAKLGYGIRAKQVGIRRVVLPEESTAKVFETMRKTRERLASSAKSSGTAQAATVISEAEAAQKRILAFAERRAQAIRAQGDKEAARYYAAFREDEALAIFLRRLETLKLILPHNATFVLDSGQLSIDQLFDDLELPGAPTGGGGTDKSGQ